MAEPHPIASADSVDAAMRQGVNHPVGTFHR